MCLGVTQYTLNGKGILSPAPAISHICCSPAPCWDRAFRLLHKYLSLSSKPFEDFLFHSGCHCAFHSLQ